VRFGSISQIVAKPVRSAIPRCKLVLRYRVGRHVVARGVVAWWRALTWVSGVAMETASSAHVTHHAVPGPRGHLIAEQACISSRISIVGPRPYKR